MLATSGRIVAVTAPDPALLTALIDRLAEYRETLMTMADRPVDVNRAATSVLAAGNAFEEDLGDTTGWFVGIFALLEDDSEGDEVVPAPLPAGQRVTVQVREDFVVVDEDALVRAGRAAYHRSWPDASDASAGQHVTSGLDALGALVHADGIEAIALNAEDLGLENAGGETLIEAVDQALQESPDW
jgi:hypothetical protein